MKLGGQNHTLTIDLEKGHMDQSCQFGFVSLRECGGVLGSNSPKDRRITICYVYPWVTTRAHVRIGA
jgi:hypothetical protein